ncbi:transforming growth factor beta receptor type 3 [Platichthys flesus]|uniref:transforming growth factor beta receptor type 3 n=1 Tax=Platichthys flesus TaxID=8260 RepID=UPI002DB812D5|nr:transforming growth factor beta receptor type 3 [Platichthys flesus]XP_062263204.1 transforming growth factor beta receptor type 3 [Platichthys flesus]
MVKMSATGRTLCCLLLLWTRTPAQAAELRCSSAGPVGALHPVQGLLETFEAGPGCAARERGDKETHVVAVRRSTNSPENKVTVLLKPLSPSPVRTLHLLLSSKLPVSWWLEAEALPPDLPVHVQVSSNSSVQSRSLRLLVHVVRPLPFRPAALHHWALTHHGNVSSLTHTTHGNWVYIRLGEDPTLPPVCQLQSTFLSPNYLTSDLQPQEVQGCSHPPAAGINPAVHVIKLHSAGSGLCGSLQVEVVVSLVPPVANAKLQDIVLILSSSVPVHWAITARGVQGHISVHSSNSVSPPFPSEPDLTLSSTLNSDLSTVSDLLVWANESGYTHVTSYTEADLANRFVVQLAGGGTDVLAVRTPLAVRPPWAEERRLRQWLNGGDGAGGRESFTVQCEDGRLSVSVDQRILQTLSVHVAAVTLQDPTCQAHSNGSHFLLVFPVISCGTEGLFLGRPRGVQYTNMMILWRDRPQTLVALNSTERKSRGPLGIHFSCLAAGPRVAGPAADGVQEVNTPQAGLVHWAPGEPAGPDPALGHHPVPRHRPGPVLILRLFVTEDHDQKRIGPCVVPAGHRVYVEISAKGPLPDAVEVKSCIVSPLSDPKKSPFWTIISEGCSSDPSLTLSAEATDEEEEEEEGDAGELEAMERMKESRIHHGDVSARHKSERGRREAPVRREESGSHMGSEEEARPLRFSFILRPVHNDSIQFLHCSLNMCSSDSTRGEDVKEPAKRVCQDGLRIPALVSKSHKHQCETRILSRPMVVTQSISSLVPKQLRPPAGQRTKRLSVSPVARPGPQDSNSVVQTGPVMGVVLAAFVMGVSLMGGLWCIYNYTAKGPTSLGGEGPLTDQTHRDHNTWNPPLLSGHASSSV